MEKIEKIKPIATVLGGIAFTAICVSLLYNAAISFSPVAAQIMSYVGVIVAPLFYFWAVTREE